MSPHKDWNRIGPRIPLWFRRRLKRIDPLLVLQYMPPRTLVGRDGVHESIYPEGVWIITRALKRCGWLYLHKTWTWSLTQSWKDADGQIREYHRPPTNEDIKVIRASRDLWRRQRQHEMSESLDRYFENVSGKLRSRSRDMKVERNRKILSSNGERQWGNRVLVT